MSDGQMSGAVPGRTGIFRVARLVPEEQAIVSIDAGTSVRDALAVMDEHGFSQLPVMAGGSVVGVFTHRSLAVNLSAVRRQDDPLDVPVDDLLEDLSYVRAHDDVGEILSHLNRDGAVLVGDPDHVVAVATTEDVISYLWEATRPFVLLQDIELALRGLMQVACGNEETTRSCIAAAFPNEDNPPQALHLLSLGQLESVLLNGENFGRYFTSAFGKNLDLVRTRLEGITDIRNKVFHFRDEVEAVELDHLVSTRQWLHRRVAIVGSR